MTGEAEVISDDMLAVWYVHLQPEDLPDKQPLTSPIAVASREDDRFVGYRFGPDRIRHLAPGVVLYVDPPGTLAPRMKLLVAGHQVWTWVKNSNGPWLSWSDIVRS